MSIIHRNKNVPYTLCFLVNFNIFISKNCSPSYLELQSEKNTIITGTLSLISWIHFLLHLFSCAAFFPPPQNGYLHITKFRQLFFSLQVSLTVYAIRVLYHKRLIFVLRLCHKLLAILAHHKWNISLAIFHEGRFYFYYKVMMKRNGFFLR